MGADSPAALTAPTHPSRARKPPAHSSALAGSERTQMVGSGALGSGAQQVVPVRFPEAQHQRLKDWCTTHGFSMAVVVRGLVERFLDEQERRAA